MPIEVTHHRCPFCHDTVFPGEEVDKVVCAGCHAFHHQECWREGSGCSCCRSRVCLSRIVDPEAGPVFAARASGEFMPWFVGVLGREESVVARAALACAEQALQVGFGDDPRPALAVNALRRYTENPTTVRRRDCLAASTGADLAADALYSLEPLRAARAIAAAARVAKGSPWPIVDWAVQACVLAVRALTPLAGGRRLAEEQVRQAVLRQISPGDQ